MCEPVNGGCNDTPINLWACGAIIIIESCAALTERQRTQRLDSINLGINAIFEILRASSKQALAMVYDKMQNRHF